MSQPEKLYTIVGRNHIAQFDVGSQSVVPGWQLLAQWASTGTILPVFVPDAKYTPDQVDAAIKAAGAKDEAIEKLGA